MEIRRIQSSLTLLICLDSRGGFLGELDEVGRPGNRHVSRGDDEPLINLGVQIASVARVIQTLHHVTQLSLVLEFETKRNDEPQLLFGFPTL